MLDQQQVIVAAALVESALQVEGLEISDRPQPTTAKHLYRLEL